MKRRDFLKNTGLLAGAGFMAGGLPLGASAKTSMKFDSYVTENAGPSWIDRWFLDELEKRTNGEVSIRRYWAGSLNKVGEHLSAVRDGTSEITLISPGYYQAEVPVTRGLEWYYRVDRADTLQLVCRDVYEQFEPLRQEWEQRHRSKVLYWTNWNYAPLVLREPINSIEDLKGKKIRGYGVATDVIERLGGIAVPMAAGEVYQALERGVLDGVYGFDFVTAVAYKLHEIAPNFYDIGDGAHAPAVTVMNRGVWEGLSDPSKKICTDLADELYTGKFTEIYETVLTDYVKKALSEGVKFTALSDAETAKARARVQPAEVDQWIETVAKPNGIDGAAMQELVEASIARHAPSGRLKRPGEIAAAL
ncbi:MULTISPECIES: C4-dicarboxylate TRAP transporter substrate-binding protein [Rhizobium/Agrobacterium group]|uniref:C4-dicarboxylate TRAP transporter substrate-binding protein n=1 Tax=Rhizobium/Agrobacterium group TaxID=227290 RepID=UPI000715DEF7|nr:MULTISPECIES: C4-dicarboxylate TRAP transporter substrate-binding protein [Rhizobium/Agrobacterium group]KRA64342.1 ABC transporter substrate-binding protein [Rhizobium sp. Root651]MDH1270437.1 C4-dicarboxylate TRAP transporter substrate-binding protein [Agrobacterium pusense]